MSNKKSSSTIKKCFHLPFIVVLSSGLWVSCGAEDPAFTEVEHRELTVAVAAAKASSADALSEDAIWDSFSKDQNEQIADSLLGREEPLAPEEADAITGTVGSSGDATSADGQDSTQPYPGSTPDGDTESGQGNKGSGSSKVPSEAALCAAHFGVSSQKVVVAGNQTTESRNIDDASIVAVKLTGNKTELNLLIQSLNGNNAMQGLCIFLAGNQTRVQVALETHLRGLVVYARGNQASAQINLGSSGSLGALYADLKGNEPQIAVQTNGQFACDSSIVKTKGNGGSYTCQ
jgi:hypothetical protein